MKHMRLFSGIQPTNSLHLGNYLGAVRNWIALQQEHDALYCIVDLHAITVPQNPKELRDNTLRVAALYVALGLNPERVTIFVQSQVKEHTELTWILQTITTMGALERMTQYKDKIRNKKILKPDVGLFVYPVLMAADILLYNTDGVPVGEDQKQHVELARDLALKFNHVFGETFVVPKPLIQKEGARIMALNDPTKKMSKSAESPNSYIALTDDAKTIRAKIQRAVTDSGKEIAAGGNTPALTNLLTMYALLANTTIPALEQRYAGKGYSEFKKDLADVVVNFLGPVQERLQKTTEAAVKKILQKGANNARKIAEKTMEKVRERIGLLS